MKVWVSAIILIEGADLSDGVRLQVSLSKKEAYADLAEWLQRDEVTPGKTSNKKVAAAMDEAVDNFEILLWRVEKHRVWSKESEIEQ